MAYVGTPKRLGTDQDTLRSVILGEAAGEGQVGMNAVASVMQNRADAGGFGGHTMVDVALAPHQFQGQVDLSRFSPEKIAMADTAIANAKAGNDPTGGALYYANPGPSTAGWAKRLNEDNSVHIGNHYFTDNVKGKEFLTQDQRDTLQDSAQDYKEDGIKPGSTGYGEQDIYKGYDGTQQQQPGEQDVYKDYNNPDEQSIYQDYDQKRHNPIIGKTVKGEPVLNNPDIPAALDDQTKYETKAINTQTQQQAKSAKDIAEAMTKDTQAAIQAAAKTTTSLRDTFTDYFSRTVFILLGLIAIAAAFYAFGKPDLSAAVKA